MKNSIGNRLLSSLLFLLAFVLGTLILVVQRPAPEIQREFVIGEPAPRTVFSPLYVKFQNEEETAKRRNIKQSEVPPIYALQTKATEAMAHDFFSEPQTKEEVSKALTLLFEGLVKKGVMEDARKKDLSGSGRLRIRLLDPATKAETEKEVKELLSVSEAKEKAWNLLEKEGIRERSAREAAVGIFSKSLKPNLIFDEPATQERLKQALEAVEPVMEEVKRGELIVPRGLLVTRDHERRLVQVHRKMAKKQTQSRFLAAALFVLLGLGFSFLYLRQLEPKEFRSPGSLILLLSVLGLTLLIERVTLLVPNSSVYLLPGALAALLLTILKGPRVGILGALAVPVLSLPLAEFRIEIVLMLLTGSLAGVLAARGVRKRIHFLKLGLAVGIVNSLVLAAFSISREWELSGVSAMIPLGLANGFLGTTLCFFLVPLFESFFNLVTDITLLELSDLNHPLLKRMVVEAPGTYHHSLVMSTLAESACEAIGANPLLARVGGYFHDIGKIARSEYFTENQTPQTGNKHDQMTPAMSSRTVMNHVKDGMELARKYKLKDVIVRFIPEHHGKGVIYYFYRRALDQAKPGERVHADEFRYPGPKPQSRETAVALLADSVEAASRSLKEMTPHGIRALTRKIINEKFIDGQLDECDLTLKDLHKIQESFVHNLMAIFHTRVSYPASQPDPHSPDLFEADQFSKFR